MPLSPAVPFCTAGSAGMTFRPVMLAAAVGGDHGRTACSECTRSWVRCRTSCSSLCTTLSPCTASSSVLLEPTGTPPAKHASPIVRHIVIIDLEHWSRGRDGPRAPPPNKIMYHGYDLYYLYVSSNIRAFAHSLTFMWTAQHGQLERRATLIKRLSRAEA